MGIKFFSKLFKNQEDDFFDIQLDEEKEEEFEWDWDHIMEDRHLFKMSDDIQREKYIKNLVEQIRDASNELDKLTIEYNRVTENLKDMDEIDSLPYNEKKEMEAACNEIIKYEGIKRDYSVKVSNISQEHYRIMERYENEVPKAISELKEAEEYRFLVKGDLQKLEGERHAYLYREQELKTDLVNYKGMAFICIGAAIICSIMLSVLQFVFEMKVSMGYLAVVLAVSVAVTILFSRYQDSKKELEQSQRGMNRIILLQNTVKIRYVNNTNLLDYVYTKYNVESSSELKKRWEDYIVERDERDRQKNNERELSLQQGKLLKILRKYQLTDVYAWLNNPMALVDKREMVEIRHAYIIQRQKLRARLDYNKKLAQEGEKEIREFINQYPEYGAEAIKMMDRYA